MGWCLTPPRRSGYSLSWVALTGESETTNTFNTFCPFEYDIMMLPTHALVGILIALPVAGVVPESTGAVLAAGLLGGMFPDLDMYVGHRRTLHYPVYYWALAGVVAVVALLFSPSVVICAAVFLTAAAVHSVSDAFGGGLELHPWEGTSERAVYDHHRDQWIRPRRWIMYDGSPGDFVLLVVFSVPLWMAVDGVFRWIVFATLAVGAIYTTVRRFLPALAIRLIAHVPPWISTSLPRRYRSAAEDGNRSRAN